jgi:hypothetical protein
VVAGGGARSGGGGWVVVGGRGGGGDWVRSEDRGRWVVCAGGQVVGWMGGVGGWCGGAVVEEAVVAVEVVVMVVVVVAAGAKLPRSPAFCVGHGLLVGSSSTRVCGPSCHRTREACQRVSPQRRPATILGTPAVPRRHARPIDPVQRPA